MEVCGEGIESCVQSTYRVEDLTSDIFMSCGPRFTSTIKGLTPNSKSLNY